jgi:hypothetical protein
MGGDGGGGGASCDTPKKEFNLGRNKGEFKKKKKSGRFFWSPCAPAGF